MSAHTYSNNGKVQKGATYNKILLTGTFDFWQFIAQAQHTLYESD